MPANTAGVEVDHDGDAVADVTEGGGRAGVDGEGGALADIAVDVPVTEGDVLPLDALGEVRRGDAQRALQLRVLGDGVAVADGDVPGAVLAPGRGRGEGPLDYVDGNGSAPDGEVEVGEVEELAFRVAEEAETGGEAFEVVAFEGAVPADGVVVTGEEDGLAGEAVDLLGREGDDIGADAGVVEEVAGDEEDIGGGPAGKVDDGFEAGFEAAAAGLVAPAGLAV